MSGISGFQGSALRLNPDDFEIDSTGRIIVMKNPKAGKVGRNGLKINVVSAEEKSAFMKLVHKNRNKK